MSEPGLLQPQGTILSTPRKSLLTRTTKGSPASASKLETMSAVTATTHISISTSNSTSHRRNTLKPSLIAISCGGTPAHMPQALSASRTREVGFIFIISMLQVIPMAEMSSVLPILRIIAQSFNITDKGLLPWMLAGYSLTFGGFILVSARLGDIFGHKNMVCIGFGWMALWSMVAGLSVYSDYVLFLFARTFQGMGAALIQPNGLVLLGRAYTPGSKKNNMGFALFGATAPTGACLGATFGAIFAQLSWWPVTFFSASVVCIVLAALASVILPTPPSSSTQILVKEKLQDMDWLGAFSGIAALVCINIAWNFAPAKGWRTQYVFSLLILGLVFAAGFVLIETRVARHPLVPFGLFGGGTGFVLAATSFGWASFGIWVYYIWQFFLQTRQYSPLDAAAHFIPILPVGLLATGLTRYLKRWLRPTWILITSMAAFTLGLALLAAVSRTQTYWSVTFLSLAVIPFAMDMSFQAATIITSNAMPKDHQGGMAGSLVSTAVNYSISLGLGVGATVEAYSNNDGRTPEDILHGFKHAWYLGAGLGAVGLVIAVAYVVVNELLPTKRTPEAADRRPRSLELLQSPLQPPRSPTGTLTPSLRTWPSQPMLAQRDRRSISILPNYEGQPPLPLSRSPGWPLLD